MKKFKRLIKSDYDFNNRLAAILIINGEIYSASTHGIALNNYLKDNNIEKIYETFNRPRFRIDLKNVTNKDDIHDIKIMQDNIYQIAFAHLIDAYGNISLETDSLYNITKKEAIDLLKKEFEFSDIYDDNTIDELGNLKKIAKNIKISRLKNKEIKNENITESRLIKSIYVDTVTRRTYDGIVQDFEIFKNPTSKETQDIRNSSKDGFVRGIINNSDIYIWNGNVLHDDLDYPDINVYKCFRFAYYNHSEWEISDYNMTLKEIYNTIINNKELLQNIGNFNTSWFITYNLNNESIFKNFIEFEEYIKNKNTIESKLD